MKWGAAEALSEQATDRPRVHYGFHSQGDESAQWAVVHVQMDGQFAAPYKLELELTGDGEPAKLLGRACSLVLSRDTHQRCVHGIVTRIAHDDARDALRVTVVPALEALRHRTECRIFQDKTVPEVLKIVLEQGLAPFERELESKLRRATYPRREYIVQYRESDLAFVERLMAEEGIWYRFVHSDKVGHAERLVLLDANEDAPEAALGPSGKRLPVDLEHGRDEHARVVHRLLVERQLGASKVEVAQANWTHPEVVEHASKAGEAEHELAHYEPHGVTLWEYQDTRYMRSDASEQATLRWEHLRGRAEQLRGYSNLEELAVGLRVEVSGTSHELDGEWVITSLHETGADTQQGGRGHHEDYANRFTAQRIEVPLRPARRPKPRVFGLALGHVVGADGKPTYEQGADDIATDEHGRVRVKMTWDRTEPGTQDATTTCWLRTAQSWSGDGWGTLFLPRIGMEVVVNFVDGDPDRPLVTGCVYNGLTKAPYPRKDQKTKSYIRTQSSPGGEGYNELLFDDAKDGELVSLRAQRDHREHVLRNQTLEIGGARSEHVQGAEQVEVQGARTHTVHGEETLRVVDGSARLLDLSGNDTKLVAKDRELTVAQKTSETYLGGRRVEVQGYDVLQVTNGAHKSQHVEGQYNIVADEHFKVQQGSDELYMKDAFYVASQGSLQLRNDGFHLRADANGNTTIDVGKQLTIRVGSAQIQLKSDGSVVVSGSKEAKLAAGGSAVAMKPSGGELKAPTLKLNGTALVEVKGAMITLN